jgi:hypothetical protein
MDPMEKARGLGGSPRTEADRAARRRTAGWLHTGTGPPKRGVRRSGCIPHGRRVCATDNATFSEGRLDRPRKILLGRSALHGGVAPSRPQGCDGAGVPTVARAVGPAWSAYSAFHGGVAPRHESRWSWSPHGLRGAEQSRTFGGGDLKGWMPFFGRRPQGRPRPTRPKCSQPSYDQEPSYKQPNQQPSPPRINLMSYCSIR